MGNHTRPLIVKKIDWRNNSHDVFSIFNSSKGQSWECLFTISLRWISFDILRNSAKWKEKFLEVCWNFNVCEDSAENMDQNVDFPDENYLRKDLHLSIITWKLKICSAFPLSVKYFHVNKSCEQIFFYFQLKKLQNSIFTCVINEWNN